MELEPKEVDPRQTDQEDTLPEPPQQTTPEDKIREEQVMPMGPDHRPKLLAEVMDKPNDQQQAASIFSILEED